MFFIIYETTNNVNGKVYRGKHKTSNIDDGYIGSGTVLRRAISKHGMQNFSREILRYCSDEDEMDFAEQELVNEEFVRRSDTYNVTLGGKGGGYWSINSRGLGMSSEKSRMMNSRWMEISSSERRVEIASHAMSIAKQEQKGPFCPLVIEKRKKSCRDFWQGASHTDEAKSKMRAAKLGLYEGDRNPQFGTMWVTNGAANKKIRKGDPIPTGWVPGRKMK